MWQFSEAARKGTWRTVGLHNPELSSSVPPGHISRIGVLSSWSQGGLEVSPEEGRRRNGERGGILVPLRNSPTAREPDTAERRVPEHHVRCAPHHCPRSSPGGQARARSVARTSSWTPQARDESKALPLLPKEAAPPTAAPHGRPRSCPGGGDRGSRGTGPAGLTVVASNIPRVGHRLPSHRRGSGLRSRALPEVRQQRAAVPGVARKSLCLQSPRHGPPTAPVSPRASWRLAFLASGGPAVLMGGFGNRQAARV